MSFLHRTSWRWNTGVMVGSQIHAYGLFPAVAVRVRRLALAMRPFTYDVVLGIPRVVRLMARGVR